MERCLFFKRSEKREVREDGRVDTQISISCGIFGSKIPGCDFGIEFECPLISKLNGEKAFVARNGYLPGENLQTLLDAIAHRKDLVVVKIEQPVPDFWEGY